MEVLKFDSVGNNEWVKLFSVPGNFPGCYLYPGGIVELENHGFIISGAIDFMVTGNDVTMFLLKIDSTGNLISFKIAADSMMTPPDWGGSVSISKSRVSDHYILSGRTTFPSMTSRSYMIQIDSAENIMSFLKFSADSFNSSGRTVCKNVENGNIACASLSIDSAGTIKLNVSKFDPFGNLIWSNLFSTDMDLGNLWDLVEKDSSYYILSQKPGVTSNDPHIFKILKSTGALEWHAAYSDFQIGYPSTIKTTDNRILFTATLGDSGLYSSLLELDTNGSIIHAQKYSWATFPFTILSIIQNQFNKVTAYGLGVVNNPYLGQCILSIDSLNQFPCVSVPININPPVFYQDSSVATGFVYTDTMSFLDITSMVITSGSSLSYMDACNFVSIDQPDLISFQISPNPTTGKLKIQTEKSIESIQVFNLFGEIILEVTARNEIDLTDQPPGIYVVKIQTDEGVFSEKVIKE
jgi:hypothetical protein